MCMEPHIMLRPECVWSSLLYFIIYLHVEVQVP